jgi:ribonuclease G
MSSELIINASLPEIRIALMEDGEIQELLVERAQEKGIVGNIYKGKVTRVLPGMQAAFVDIGLDKAAFLYVDDVFVHTDLHSPLLPLPGSGKIQPIQSKSERLEEAALAQQQEDASDLALDGKQEPSHQAQESPDAGVAVESETFAPAALIEPLIEPIDKEGLPTFQNELSGETQAAPLIEAKGTEKLESKGSIGQDQPLEKEEGLLQAARKRLRRLKFKRSAPASDPNVSEAAASSAASEAELAHTLYRVEKANTAAEVFGEERGVSELAAEPLMPIIQEGLDIAEGAYMDDFSTANQGLREPPMEDVASVGSLENPAAKREIKISAQGRTADRRLKSKDTNRFTKAQVNIQDLLKEGQEVIVQVAKDAIAAKGARLTCHISLPGRHLVCMPTINHVGVSRRIDRDDERRRLKDFVEKNRPKTLGFIVRTASGKHQSERRIRQDIDYLTKLWSEIREKTLVTKAPGLIYEDLNVVLRSVRDWVTEETGKLRVDSKKYYQEILHFVGHFMPSLRQKVELYHGDIPIFDAYNISTELSRALERKVWLKSGGYIVIDQAEALVAIDVNTGRFVGKKNLEDTILKTNLEAVKEIAYQLRLRNCGGIIILDLIDMEKEENRHRVYRALEEHLSKDRARPTILKISELGLVEMTRKRTRDTIIRTLCSSCSYCEGKGFIKSKQTVAYEVLREIEREGVDKETGKVLVQAHSDVIDVLAIDEKEALDLMEKQSRKLIFLQAVKDFHPEQFEISSEKKEQRRKHKGSSGSPTHSEGKMKIEPKPFKSHGSSHNSPNESRAGATASPKAAIIPQKEASEGAEPMSSKESTVSNDSRDNLDNDEEDRLAFLRAQAAQDAALARLNSTSATISLTSNGGSGARKPHVNHNHPNNNQHRNKNRNNNNRRHAGSPGTTPQHQKNGKNNKHHQKASAGRDVYPVREPSNAAALHDEQDGQVMMLGAHREKP